MRFLDQTEHQHDLTVTSVGIDGDGDGEVDVNKLNDWLGDLLSTKGVDIFRSKGILALAGDADQYVFQGVHMLFDGDTGRAWHPDERRTNRLVFIGRNLDRTELESGFAGCLVSPHWPGGLALAAPGPPGARLGGHHERARPPTAATRTAAGDGRAAPRVAAGGVDDPPASAIFRLVFGIRGVLATATTVGARRRHDKDRDHRRRRRVRRSAHRGDRADTSGLRHAGDPGW